jgi:stage II sporulation protein D
MISREPDLRVGILEDYGEVRGTFDGAFIDATGAQRQGKFACTLFGSDLRIRFDAPRDEVSARSFSFVPASADATFVLHDVTIGVNFHWERKESQTFRGSLELIAPSARGITAINVVPLEEYLKSVISSEMSATAPQALLQAHAITSRSWLVAMLERAGEGGHETQAVSPITPETQEVRRWYTREDHTRFDVCADDHCQRYQGITKIITPEVAAAVEATRGQFLVFDGRICDARFYKSCGGLTELFASCWEDSDMPYLRSISDSPAAFPPIVSEEQLRSWVLSSPDAFCNTTDGSILRQVLPSFDQETSDFFRWTVVYEQKELDELLLRKSGINFGTVLALVPLAWGPSGRITRLRIEGTERTIVVGKELEIRRWLSPSHLYSSAFIVETERDGKGIPERFTLRGAGWGHGVGLCQIGAAVMAVKGYTADAIVHHYFRGAELRRLY